MSLFLVSFEILVTQASMLGQEYIIAFYREEKLSMAEMDDLCEMTQPLPGKSRTRS